jgi:Leucine-rich repeat (LRR) protein
MKILLKAMETEQDLTRFMNFCETHGIDTIARNGNSLSLDMINFENGSINWGGYGSGFGVGPHLFGYFKLAYPGGDPPRGKSFANVKMVITGSLSKHDVAEITAKVEAKGGVVVSKVDETVNLLVVGNKPNAKLVKKAEGLGQVVILDEARFAGLLPAPRKARAKRNPSAAKIKKFLTRRDYGVIDAGIELARSFDDTGVFEEFLDGCTIDEEGELQRSKLFSGSGPAQPYLDYALLELIANAPEAAGLDRSLRLSNISCLALGRSYYSRWKENCFRRPPSFPNFTGLTSLSLFGCGQLESLDVLKGCKKLKSLSLVGCSDLQNLDGLSNCTKLTELNLEGCSSLENLVGLAGCTKLKSLDLSWCDFVALPPGLAECKSLTELNLGSCDSLEDVGALSGCTKLAKLGLDSCSALKNVDGLANCSNLTTLDLSSCSSLESLEGLAGCTNLKSLDLSCGDFVSLPKGFTNCTKLADLRLSYCDALKSVGDLTNCTKLGKLDLDGCRSLRDMVGLAHCTKLTELNLRECSSLESLDDLAGCKNLKSLDMAKCTSADPQPSPVNMTTRKQVAAYQTKLLRNQARANKAASKKR